MCSLTWDAVVFVYRNDHSTDWVYKWSRKARLGEPTSHNDQRCWLDIIPDKNKNIGTFHHLFSSLFIVIQESVLYSFYHFRDGGSCRDWITCFTHKTTEENQVCYLMKFSFYIHFKSHNRFLKNGATEYFKYPYEMVWSWFSWNSYKPPKQIASES